MTTINYNGLTLTLEATRYSSSGNLALVLTEESTGYLYETVTVDAPPHVIDGSRLRCYPGYR